MAEDVTLRPMAAVDCQAVAALVKELAADAGVETIPKLDAKALAAAVLGAEPLIDAVVASRAGAVVGACLTLMTYSTMRAAMGLYVVDLVVGRAARSGGIGAALLRESVRRGSARGARFVKLEVDIRNPRAAVFYERLGFTRKNEDRLFILEADAAAALLSK